MKHANSRSFTIIETVLAIVLAAITISVFIASFVLSFSFLRRSMEMRTASLVLQQEMSMVRELKFSEIQALGGTFASAAMSSLRGASGTVSHSSYEGREKIIHITFKLDWTDFNGRPATRTLATLITDHGINKK